MIAADGRTVWLREHVSIIDGAEHSRGLHGFLLDITEQRQVQDVMEALARTSSTNNPDDFFQACVRKLAGAYGARYAFIGLLQPSRQDVMTLAVWGGDGYAPNFEYNLEGTPCKDILDLKKELIPRDASCLYPDDAMLVQMGIESYFGTPLIASSGDMMGLISVMDIKPMELTRWTAPILGVFASRVAVELERKAALDSLHELNASLEQRVRQRTLELEAANHELEAFSYSVSHDLRAPLRAIDGFSQALVEDYGPLLDEPGHKLLQRVRAGARNMGALIDAMLQLSRIGRKTLQPDTVDLSLMAHHILDLLATGEPARQLALDITPGLSAWGDAQLLHAALGNLLDNAWKYSTKTPHAQIAFGQEQQDGQTVYFVRDNGVGFDMAHAGKLFGAFQRLHHRTEFEGIGIGLATVQRIIHCHGGRIWAEAAPGQGATFYFTLPAQVA
jgi:signal transduction histidine kinase